VSFPTLWVAVGRFWRATFVGDRQSVAGCHSVAATVALRIQQNPWKLAEYSLRGDDYGGHLAVHSVAATEGSAGSPRCGGRHRRPMISIFVATTPLQAPGLS
jgi:hypothetical protein